MRVLWLAPYNLRLLRPHVPDIGRGIHAAPWITHGSEAIRSVSGIDLHIAIVERRVGQDLDFVHNGISFHVLGTPLPAVPRALVLYHLDLPRIKALVRRIAPDVVHGHGTETVFGLAAVSSGLPHVLSMQAVMARLAKVQRRLSRTALHYGIVALAEKRALRLARTVLVEAPFIIEDVRRHNATARVNVVGNIVSPEFFASERVDHSGNQRLLFVGSLVREKGIEEAIAAFHVVAARFPAAELRIAGRGSESYVARLKHLASEGPGRDRVRFLGQLTAYELAHEHAGSALLLAPTYFDSSPNVVSEAMVSGLPVISAAVGGVPYMLDEGRAGTLVPPRDADAVARSVWWAFEHPDEVRQLSELARRVARERYSRRPYIAGVLDAYDSALAAPAIH